MALHPALWESVACLHIAICNLQVKSKKQHCESTLASQQDQRWGTFTWPQQNWILKSW